VAHGVLLADAVALSHNPSSRAISAIGLVLAVVFLVVRRQNPRSDWLASVVLPAATILVVIGEAIPVPARVPVGHADRPLRLAAHVASNIVGEALLLFAGASAGAYLVADRQLKRKQKTKPRPGGVAALPSLGALDRAGHHLTAAGFVLLTLGLALAPAGGLSFEGPVSTRVRALFGVLSWALLALVLAARTLGGWHGRKSAIGTLTGVAVTSFVVAAYAVRSLGAGVGP
jgi:ABC-type uncharacterized transport system permease subunit